MKIKKILGVGALALAGMMATGCSVPKDIAYFQTDATVVELAKEQQIKVRPDDKIVIIVKAKDPAVAALFNLPIYSTRMGTGTDIELPTGVRSQNYRPSGTEGVGNYTVSPSGTIDFPMLGVLKVEGMTRSELAGYIKGELQGRDLVKDPVVTVEFVNTGYNVMGEVTDPGRYNINQNSVNILEALTLAGDLTITGRRDNVRVLREEEGKMKVYTLDLTDLEKTVQSPAYYLQQNDVIYVEPNDMKKRSTRVNGNNTMNVSFWISVASLLTTVATTVGVFVTK